MKEIKNILGKVIKKHDKILITDILTDIIYKPKKQKELLDIEINNNDYYYVSYMDINRQFVGSEQIVHKYPLINILAFERLSKKMHTGKVEIFEHNNMNIYGLVSKYSKTYIPYILSKNNNDVDIKFFRNCKKIRFDYIDLSPIGLDDDGFTYIHLLNIKCLCSISN